MSKHYYVRVTVDDVTPDIDGEVLVKTGGRSAVWLPIEELIPENRVTVLDPEPTGLGAVVRDGEGDLWLRDGDEWRCHSSSGRPTGYAISWRKLVETYGPIAVEQEGVQ